MRLLARLRSLLPFLLLLAAPPGARAQEAPPGYDPGVYELVVAGLAPVSLPVLVSPGGAVLLPLRPVLELTGVPFELRADSGRVSVARPLGVGTATLDAATRTLQAAGRTVLPPDQLVAFGGELYLSPEAIGALLEARAQAEPAELRLVLSRDPPFPAQTRLDNQARRAGELLRLPRGQAGGELRVPFVPRTGGGVVEWGVSTSYPDAYRPTGAFARVGLSVLGGMARLGATASDPGGDGIDGAELTAAFHRVFPDGNIVRQVQVGDVVAEGLRARSIRGITLSNAPFVRDALFGEAVFRPELPTGWEYEIYQEGQLLGFSDASTAGPVRIPLRYGSTPVQLRLFGPAGERVTSELVYLVPVLQLPAGRWQYAAGAGLCPADDCDTYSFADLRHGLSQWLTVFGGMEAVGDSAGTALRPYGGASIVPARAWVVELQGMHRSFLQASAQNFGTGRLSGGAGAGISYPGPDNLTVVGSGGFSLLPSAVRSWHADGSLRVRLQPEGWVRSLELSGRADGALEGAADSAQEARGLERMQLSASVSVRRLLVETTYEDTRTLGPLYLGRVTLPLTRGVPRWLQTPTLSAAVGHDGARLRRWEVTATAQPRGAIVNLTTRWNQGSRPVVLLGTQVRLGFGRAQARTLAQPGQPTSGAFSLDGAATFGQCTGVQPLRYGGLGLSGVTGFIFKDRNGDGLFGVDEESVPGASVGIGGLRVRSDTTGRYRAWSVLPYEILPVTLDTASLADPAWVPVHTDLVLRPSPHLYTYVNFPLVQTRELTGALVPGPGVPTAGALTVEIVELATGAVQRTVTFSDGEFYVGRLRPGTYEVRVAGSSLRALGAAAQPAATRVVVSASGDEPVVQVPAIRLVRAGPGAALPSPAPAARRAVLAVATPSAPPC